jgi:hypothetical protein
MLRPGRPPAPGWGQKRVPVLADQVAGRDEQPVLGNGAIEPAIATIRSVLECRAWCFRNAEWVNRLLELVRLRIDRVDNADRYAASIRAHLAGIHVGADQRTVTR